MRSQEEHLSQANFFEWCQLHERYHPGLARFFAVPNGSFRHKATAGRLRSEGVRRGIPDVMNLTQGEGIENGKPYEFRGLILEFKSSKGKLSPEQKDWCAHFREQGFRVEVPRSWAEAALITIDYFGLPESLKKNLPLHRVAERSATCTQRQEESSVGKQPIA